MPTLILGIVAGYFLALAVALLILQGAAPPSRRKTMQPLRSYIAPAPARAPQDSGTLVEVADALRSPKAAEDILERIGVPRLLRGLVAPYVRRALTLAADWIDPRRSNPL